MQIETCIERFSITKKAHVRRQMLFRRSWLQVKLRLPFDYRKKKNMVFTCVNI